MKEYKFRFWCKKGKQWVKNMGLDENGKIVDLSECFQNDAGENGEYYIIQQYTGIKSKDGKEIHEGDIVKAHDSWDNRSFCGEVIYSQDLASFVFLSDGDEYYLTSFDLEIVGNIFKSSRGFEEKIGFDKERCDMVMEALDKIRPVGKLF